MLAGAGWVWQRESVRVGREHYVSLRSEAGNRSRVVYLAALGPHPLTGVRSRRMEMVRCLLLGALAAVGLLACTPEEVAFHTAAAFDAEVRGLPCARWAGFIRAEGLPEHFLTVMARESGCSEGAHNRSGATGLLQIMPMWADDCGVTPVELFDGPTNIACAAHVYAVQGGDAWTTW